MFLLLKIEPNIMFKKISFERASSIVQSPPLNENREN
jgi:hypothetical protein